MLQTYLTTTVQACEKPALHLENFCRNLQAIAQSRLQDITNKLTHIRELLITNNRTKRGLIDGIGYIGKTLFGVMDADDEKRINSQIDLLKRENAALKINVKEQLQVIDIGLKLFNNTVQNIKFNERVLLNATYRLEQTLTDELNKIESRTSLDEQLTIISTAIHSLASQTQDLLSYVTDLKRGILGPNVLSPATILEYLTQALPSLPQGLRYPITLNLENIYSIDSIAKLKAYSKDRSIITILEIPLINNREFRLNKIHPLPAKVNQTLYAYVDTKETHIAINQVTQEYIHFTNKDLKKCKLLKTQYLCESNHPIFKISTNGPCEVQLYSPIVQKPTNCPYRYLTINHTILVELEKPGTWIYVTPRTTQIAITCNQGKTTYSDLKDSGILVITDQCTITTPEFTIETSKQYDMNKSWSYLPVANLTFDTLQSQLNSSIVSLAISNQIRLKPIIKDPEELHIASARLRDIEKHLSQSPPEIPTEYHFGIVTSISLSGLIIFAIVIAILYYYLKPKIPTISYDTEQNVRRPFPRARTLGLSKIEKAAETDTL